ncbi:PIN domain-containing protein [Anabaena cylindrica FACHB-243]|uniref:PilT protein domain protein n=1 Tax=Anabaena cylindrica (strain ATCC 27899 / PCC 7122) TaxID=272123 RepID=K9ZD61_ANACC|nr:MULTISPECIES: PIN domain-containing protein [Anabaena]AFZ56654.1 PilT protein domain protein [Anabaena cylindrica PCC 7122]MBD2416175.1 PIN domain-containing protein [Anabaena cylindrica FACHB-243]MBY5285795.1 PIN domain-containing protein [Anabaena sp. CCAP 1446/1C]MBY5311749.1 PIN domain-containing protein [Anabaena sp. CCAP 1446/1C]MCM2408657.1 PIN domain-containing protein [Anabaena sp. CCAP 1446/1C]
MKDYPPIILTDSSILFAYYSVKDNYNESVCNFFEQCSSELITTTACVTEVMYLLSRDYRTQNEFLKDLAQKLYQCIPLVSQDFTRIRELNEQYADLPGDFADLSLITISERLNIAAIVTLDTDFDIYRRYRKQPFERVYLDS